jgi:hypothetical protein
MQLTVAPTRAYPLALPGHGAYSDNWRRNPHAGRRVRSGGTSHAADGLERASERPLARSR